MSEQTRAGEPTARPKRGAGPEAAVDVDPADADANGSGSVPAIAPKSAAGSGTAVPPTSAPGIGPKSDGTGPRRRIGPKPVADTPPTTRSPAGTNEGSVDE